MEVFYPMKSKGEVDEVLRLRREEAKEQEESVLSPFAALSKDHNRHFGAEEDHRLPYKRDVDRIVHSRAYARYIDKTQVLYLVDNDHITHRLLHVQLVSNFARGIAEILRLNCDLVEAIALGHDVGHPPFGHEGEGYLSKLSEEFGNGPFDHPVQSCRLLREIEPLNLGLAVYDGFLCHDGGLSGTTIAPDRERGWEEHLAGANGAPMTLEGCLVKLCDTASYLGRDIEDAVRVGLIKREEVPKTILGTTNREILSTVAGDIIRQSFEKDHVAMSEEVLEALKVIRKFNFEAIYTKPEIKVESERVERGYRLLFEMLLGDFEKKGEGGHLWNDFLHNKPERYLSESSPVQKVIDYISGMTDKFFVRTLEKLCIPQKIHLS